ncbi:MAG: hypothetical protein ABIF82_03240 [Planctomycetota bacterium]
MSQHVTDDELILHFYGEAANEAPRVDTHLAECGECRDNWLSLRHTLTLVDSAEAPDAPEGFERVMWARVRPSLPPPLGARPRWWSPRMWAPIAGVAAVIAVAFVGGRLWPRAIPPAVPAVSDEADARTTRERVLLSALGDHFEQTEMLLVEIKNTPDAAPLNLRFEQQAARELVAAGRLYRETAAQGGDTQLTAVLEDLERVLVDVAGGPDQMNAQDLESLRARIEDDSLLFKVRALTTAVLEREKSLSTRSKRTL